MRKVFVAWWLALGVMFGAASSAAAAETVPTRVLVIHQYGMDMPFRVAFDPALQKALRSAVIGPLEIYSEVLELYRFPAPDHSQLMRRFLREKYQGRSIDVVVAVYDTALEFVRTYHDELFPGVPIVGLTTRLLEPRAGEPLTGIWTGSNLAETVSLGLQLHPATRHLYVVESALRNIGAYQEAARSFHDFEPRRLDHVPARSAAQRGRGDALRAAPPDSLVLYLRQMIGANGETIDQVNGLSRVRAATSLPVYGTAQSLVGAGLIGGYVSSVEGNAARVADLALACRVRDARRRPSRRRPASSCRCSTGASSGNTASPSPHCPPEAASCSRSRPSGRSIADYVLGAALVIAAQALLIGALLVHRRRRQRAEQALRRSEARNRATLRAVPDLMFLFNKDGVYLDYHARDPGLLIAPPEQLLGRRLADVMPPELVLDVHARARVGEPRRRTAGRRVRA